MKKLPTYDARNETVKKLLLLNELESGLAEDADV
jgi:hypothetical protein